MLALYSLAIFVSAILLFSMEPMVGKMVLPQYGGTPSVWNACMVFFQMALLLGYGYTHLSTSILGVRRQAVMHLVVILLPLLVLPVLFDNQSGPPSNVNPSLWLLAQLTLVVGLPFFVVSTTAPLLQRWFVNTGHAGSHDPYFLYSTSNAGSLLALLSYPFFIEPRLGLVRQTHVWTGGYAVLVFLIICCSLLMWITSRSKTQTPPGKQADDRQTSENLYQGEQPAEEGASLLRQRLCWIFLAFIPSSLMLGVTTHISTDIASAPLLWIIPLVLYLLSFVIVFARRPLLPHWLMIAIMPFAVLMMPLLAFRNPMKFWITIPIHLLTFFIVAMVCHGELARSRPAGHRLTEFYLWMSLGGVFGGLFNSLVAPQIFTSVAEYPLVLAAACFFRPSGKDGAKRTELNSRDVMWLLGLIAVALGMAGFTRRLESLLGAPNIFLDCILVYGAPAIICFGFRDRPIRFALGVGAIFLTVSYFLSVQSGNLLFAERNFYGINRVFEGERFNYLFNGNIIHGLQEMHPETRYEPLGYFSRKGPLGDLACAFDQSKPNRQVGVIGLGTGSMAAYAQEGQQFTFYEIDPAVIHIASDAKLFTFLQQCPGRWEIIEGDARLQLEKAPDGQYDTLILDAFSSDSIPMHLLTQEALDLYCRKIKPDGILVLHITNRYLNLQPVLAALAEKSNLVCLGRADLKVSKEEQLNGRYPSRYLVMAQRQSDLGNLPENPLWSRPEMLPGVHGWTDDYSNILSVLCW